MGSKTYKELLSSVDTFLFDVDGVFTDGRVLLFPGIDPVRTFHSRDAFAVQHALKEGFRIVIITGGKSDGVEQSFARLGVKEFHYHVFDKSRKLDELVAQGLDLSRVAYMGDDLPDLKVMQRVALACCPADAAVEIKAISHFVSAKNGGMGCVRDLLEQALKAKGKWMTANAHTW